MVTASSTDTARLKAQLEKRATFIEAVRDLETLVRTDPGFSLSTEAMQLAKRSINILRARHTNPSFWASGRKFLQALADRTEGQDRQQLSSWIAECAAAEQPDEAQSAQEHQRPSSLFEGQLSREEPEPAPQPLGDLLQRLMTGTVQDAHVDQAHDQDIVEALIRSMEDDQPSARPPAAKYAVQQLKAYLYHRAANGNSLQCCVCQEDFDEGERVQEMPCNSAHAFHAACLAPWLAKENSCPICRHELPTDDGRYERDKAEAVKAKGAANAVSHKEFIYL